MDDAKSLVRSTVELASLPAVVHRALELLNRPNSSASEIGRVISEDPALTARLLKIVNSSFYGFPSRIETVSRAITIVGTAELTDLILGTSAIDAFAKLPNRLINMQGFWEHSLYAAVVARILARQLWATDTERCFVMALLHDIGTLVMCRKLPDLAGRAMELAASAGIPLHTAEQEIFGFDHGSVAAELMLAWQLPASFVTVARYHHQPSAAPDFALETATVHLADVISGMAQGSASGSGQTPALETGTWELTGLSVDVMEPVIAEADARFGEACAALLPRASAA